MDDTHPLLTHAFCHFLRVVSVQTPQKLFLLDVNLCLTWCRLREQKLGESSLYRLITSTILFLQLFIYLLDLIMLLL